MKVLIVADERVVAEEAAAGLRIVWPQTEVDIASVETGASEAETWSPDIVMLESGSGGEDAFLLLEEIRGFSDVPIIVWIGSDSPIDRARSLELGADDFLVKPFGTLDLIVRIRAVLRRTTMPELRDRAESRLHRGDLTIDFAMRDVTVAGRQVHLTPTEYELLCNLVRNEHKVLSHRFLLEKTWGASYGSEKAHLKKYVHRLRAKLNNGAENGVAITTHRGIGYSFVTRS